MSNTIGRVTEAQVRREMIRMDGKASRRRFRIGAASTGATRIGFT